MTAPFVLVGDTVTVRLTEAEVALLRQLPALLAGVGHQVGDPAAQRLDYQPHPDDPDAATAYADMLGDRLERERRHDRMAFEASLVGEAMLDIETADAWLRVLGEARLSLAARLGITEDWQPDSRSRDPQIIALNYLSYLQDALVDALLGGVELEG
ncbi:MAG TPA: DUF2017 family protein [Acidimicrobiia bacterium]